MFLQDKFSSHKKFPENIPSSLTKISKIAWIHLMHGTILKSSFFQRPALIVAEQLIGCEICREIDNTIQRYMILETEAYLGEEDLASHAHFGKTKRNEAMYACGGIWYVYLCYGIHHMLNIVTGAENQPEAVLLRSITNYPGPGKLSHALNISFKLNKQPCDPSSGLWIEAPQKVSKIVIEKNPRIGVHYAGTIWANKPYRFTAKNV